MYVKPFRPKHLRALRDLEGIPENTPIPALGWLVIEDGEVLAAGFFRQMEGGMMAVEGPYLGPYLKRSVEAGHLLEKLFMVEAMDRGVALVRLKAYKP